MLPVNDARRHGDDTALRTKIFERPETTIGVGGPGHHSRHDIDHSDPHLAAYRARAAGSAGAALAIDAGYQNTL